MMRSRPGGIAVPILAMALMAITAGMTIDSRSFWLDEASTWRIIAQPTWPEFVDGVGAVAGNMFGYLGIMRAWSALGTGEVVLRLPSMFFAIATVGAGFMLGRRWVGPGTAAVTAVLLGSNVPLTFFATEARSYAMLALFGTLCWLATDFAIERDRVASWMLVGLAALGAVGAHMVALMLFPALGLIVKLHFGWRATAVRCMPIGAAALVGIAVVAASPSRDASFPPPVSPTVVARSARILLGDHGTFTSDGSGFIIMALTAGLLAMATVAAVRRSDWVDKRRVTIWIAALVPPLTTLAVSIGVTPVLWHRMLLGSLVPVVVLVAGAITGLRRKTVRLAVGTALVVLSIVRTAAIADLPLWEFRELHDHLDRTAPPGVALVFVETWERPGVDYYFRDDPERFRMVPPIGPNRDLGDAATNVALLETLRSGEEAIVIDAAQAGQVWADDQRQPDEFNFDEFDDASGQGFELIDEQLVGRFMVRTYRKR